MNNSKNSAINLNKGSTKITKLPLPKEKSRKFVLKKTIPSKFAHLIEKKTKLESETNRNFIKTSSKKLFSQKARLINIPTTINYTDRETSIM